MPGIQRRSRGLTLRRLPTSLLTFGALASSASAYACGPVELLKNFEPEFPGLWTERFTVDRSAAKEVGGTVSFGSRGDIDVDGVTTILEAAESVGVDLPYGCRMGICAT